MCLLVATYRKNYLIMKWPSLTAKKRINCLLLKKNVFKDWQMVTSTVMRDPKIILVHVSHHFLTEILSEAYDHN